jgi:alpha-ketoglutarate-dependent taurine dioxygenase
VVFSAHPLDPIGAELRGCDLGQGLSDPAFLELRAALLEHGVLVLREQTLDEAQQIALGRRFGALEGQEFNLDGSDLLVISNVLPDGRVASLQSGRMKSISINEVWHTDSSFRPTPAAVSIFKAVEVPPEGGDTFYASLRRGWLELAPERRAKLAGLRAIHDYAAAYEKAGGRLPDEAQRLMEPVLHPMLRRHPETGETHLYVSGHARDIEGILVHPPGAGLPAPLAHRRPGAVGQPLDAAPGPGLRRAAPKGHAPRSGRRRRPGGRGELAGLRPLMMSCRPALDPRRRE